MQILKYIILIIEGTVFIFLGFATLYILIFGIAGLFRYRQKNNPVSLVRRIAVLIPGYKEDNVIIDTTCRVKQYVKQSTSDTHRHIQNSTEHSTTQ